MMTPTALPSVCWISHFFRVSLSSEKLTAISGVGTYLVVFPGAD